MLTRRSFVGGVAISAVTASLNACKSAERSIPGRIVGAPAALGHRLRDGSFPAPTSTRHVDVVVAGGGIAGLTAARKLVRDGVGDLLILEAAETVGGNASSGENSVSAFPWGAHYVPLVRQDDEALINLFRDMNIISGFESDLPIYNEYFLSADPQERLFLHGQWQEGLVPMLGANAQDRSHYRDFFKLIAELKQAKGRDGKPLFAIPISRSSADEEWRALDRITMTDFLKQRGFTSASLHWYVDYCCRDDYGASASITSAWAGLHYFASRNGRAANASPSSVVTWPEGNGFFVRSWKENLCDRIQTNAFVFAVNSTAQGATLDYFDATENRSVRIEARAVILALPQYVVRRIWNGAGSIEPHEYSPWMVANLTLDRPPEGRGMDLAWDNVIQDSAMLGYIVANHQSLRRHKQETVITYYWPLSHTDAPAARREALTRTHFDWQTIVTADLYRVHPELIGHVRNLDVMVWGHGMRRPLPGSVWQEAPTAPTGPIFIGHSDQSAVSIFEEAFHNGVTAADRCRAFLGKRAALA